MRLFSVKKLKTSLKLASLTPILSPKGVIYDEVKFIYIKKR